MNIQTIKTKKLTPDNNIYEVLDESLPKLNNGTIVALTSKIVSICEKSVAKIGDIPKNELVRSESNYYLPDTLSKYGFQFTITEQTLIPMAGIDESNSGGYYVLWPKNVQKSANEIRKYLLEKHNICDLGVLITDSTCQPLRYGTVGISLGYSGFLPLRNYIGTPDLFGRPFGVTQANIAGGLASSAVLAMGEGSEQTPICIITDVPFVEFQKRNPNKNELDALSIPIEEDLFAPFLTKVMWKKGGRSGF